MISVVIPVYNRHDVIKNALDSIVSTNEKDLEVIVVDDSSDKDYGYLKEDYPFINLVKTPFNVGAGVAREYGIRFTNGEWILFLDSDDILCPGIFKEFKKIPNLKDYDMVNFTTKIIELEAPPTYCRTEDSLHGKLFRRSTIVNNHIHFHPQFRFYEDTYFYKAFSMVCRKVYNSDYTGYHLIENTRSTTKNICEDWLNKMYNLGVDVLCSLYEGYQGIAYDEYDIIRNANDLILRMRDIYDETKELAYFRIFDSLHRCLKFDRSFQLTELEEKYNLIPSNRKDRTYLMFEKWKKKYEKTILTVVIPLYNSYKYIEKTLNKLYSVINEHVEVILTDDNSDTPWLYNHLIDKYENLTIIYNPKRVYMGGNRNRAIKAAHGIYICFLDHDDEITKEGFDFFLKTYARSYSVIEGRVVRGYKNGTKEVGSRHELLHGRFYKRRFLIDNDIFFDNRLKTSEDSYFMRLVYLKAQDSILYTDTVFYIWNYVKESAMNKLYNGRDFLETFYVDHVRACIAAFDYYDCEECLRKENFVSLLYNADIWNEIWKKNSKNFFKFNVKVNIAILLEIEHRYGITRYSIDTFIEEAKKVNSYMFKKFGFSYERLNLLDECYDLIDRLTPKQKKEIRDMLRLVDNDTPVPSETNEDVLIIMSAIADLYEMLAETRSMTEQLLTDKQSS